jgi:hypothetical protein
VTWWIVIVNVTNPLNDKISLLLVRKDKEEMVCAGIWKLLGNVEQIPTKSNPYK